MKYQAGLLQQKGSVAFFEVLGSAFLDCLALAQRLRMPLIVLGALYDLGLLGGSALSPHPTVTHTTSDGTISVNYSSSGGSIFVLVLAFFALAEAVRTIVPEFRMTAGRFFSLLGWTILSGLCIGIGFIAFVVPGFWLLGRLMPTGYMVLLRPNENPMAASWESTKGLYWPTMGLIIFTAMATSMIQGFASGLESFAGAWAPLALPLGPIAFVLQAVVVIVSSLTYVRWTNELLLVRDAGGWKSLTPTQAAGIVP